MELVGKVVVAVVLWVETLLEGGEQADPAASVVSSVATVAVALCGKTHTGDTELTYFSYLSSKHLDGSHFLYYISRILMWLTLFYALEILLITSLKNIVLCLPLIFIFMGGENAYCELKN